MTVYGDFLRSVLLYSIFIVIFYLIILYVQCVTVLLVYFAKYKGVKNLLVSQF